jgi:hypothetical protein
VAGYFELVRGIPSVTKCKIGDGSTVLFWKDFWTNGTLLCDQFPRVYSFVIDDDISVVAFKSTDVLSFILTLCFHFQ